MGCWGISPNATEKEKVKSEFADYIKELFIKCPCCGHADGFNCFVPHEEFMKRYRT